VDSNRLIPRIKKPIPGMGKESNHQWHMTLSDEECQSCPKLNYSLAVSFFLFDAVDHKAEMSSWAARVAASVEEVAGICTWCGNHSKVSVVCSAPVSIM
jgi:hypothetical protein